MSGPIRPTGATRKTRNDEILDFLRTFANWAITQVEAIERSPAVEREWATAYMRSIQAMCEFWERTLADRVMAWQREDEARGQVDLLN